MHLRLFFVYGCHENQTINHRNNVLCMFTEFHCNVYYVPLARYNDKQLYQEILPEAICCCLQTYLFLILTPLIEYITYKVFFTYPLSPVSYIAWGYIMFFIVNKIC